VGCFDSSLRTELTSVSNFYGFISFSKSLLKVKTTFSVAPLVAGLYGALLTCWTPPLAARKSVNSLVVNYNLILYI